MACKMLAREDSCVTIHESHELHRISREIVNMIHHEFDTPLTIESCATRLHYNADYAGNVFRREMNIPFREYLAQYRHRMAKQWLREGLLPIKTIAERLSYNNPQNFIRSFRKLEGITPGAYKNMIKNHR